MYETGVVYLAGTGTGDPSMLTVRCLEVLGRAEVIVFEPSLSDDIQELFPVGCERIPIEPGGVGASGVLVDRAEEGKSVVRLYWGDPYNWGGSVDEAKALTREGIPFEVVPGMMPPLAAATFAGIPLKTNSEVGGITILKFPLFDGARLRDSACCQLANEGSTLAFMTDTDSIVNLISELIAGGVPAAIPVAIVEGGGAPSQRVIESTLEAAPDASEVGVPSAPCVAIVGEVARLRCELNWFEGRPLHGRRILITRPREQADRFARVLDELGVDSIVAPTIRIMPPDDWSPLDAALSELDSYHWVIFTSANGVRFFAERLLSSGLDARSFAKGVKILAIGPATAHALENILRLKADGVPETYVAEGILEMMSDEALAGKQVLIPRALEAREILPETLSERGAVVNVVTAYQTLPADVSDANRMREAISSGRIEMVTFTSSSTVRNFAEMLGEDFIESSMGRVVVASIGPVTSETAREVGLDPHVEAEVSTIPGLARAIVDFYRFNPSVDWSDPAPWVGTH
jgi:uroporphyrinogen III methyltransferase/synthase